MLNREIHIGVFIEKSNPINKYTAFNLTQLIIVTTALMDVLDN